jgi:hypothetical protein
VRRVPVAPELLGPPDVSVCSCAETLELCPKSGRVRKPLQYRFQDEAGEWHGGFTVSDPMGRSTAGTCSTSRTSQVCLDGVRGPGDDRQHGHSIPPWIAGTATSSNERSAPSPSSRKDQRSNRRGHGGRPGSRSLITVAAKMLRLDLPKTKADLERGLSEFVLDCTACVQGPLGPGREHVGPWEVGHRFPARAETLLRWRPSDTSGARTGTRSLAQSRAARVRRLGWPGTNLLDHGAWSRRNHERRSHPQSGTRVIQPHRICGDQVHRDRDYRPCHPGLPCLVHRPGLQVSAQVNPARKSHLEARAISFSEFSEIRLSGSEPSWAAWSHPWFS